HIVEAQIRAVAEDLRPGAVKSGMLATRELVEVVASAIVRHSLRNYVLDPVMVSTSGARLLAVEAERSIVTDLLPLARVITPNLDEASLLLGQPVDNTDQMRAAAQRLVEMGAQAVLMKGGHLADPEVTDILYD